MHFSRDEPPCWLQGRGAPMAFSKPVHGRVVYNQPYSREEIFLLSKGLNQPN
jgi:hypothetical protein